MGVNTDSLRWFQQVADGVTVTEVSDLEQVTQPGVSRALARLESEVGTPLLQRSGRVLRMTRAGAAFKRHVDAMLHELDDGLAAVNQLLDPDSGTVAIAFQASLGTWLVPDLISSFRRHRPDVRFVLAEVRNELGPSQVVQGQVDLEISALYERGPGMQWSPFLTERLVLAVPAGHPLAKSRRVRLVEASEEAFVGLPETSALRRQCDELSRAAGFDPSVAFECADLAAVRGFVAAGLGVAIVPEPRRIRESSAADRVAFVALSDAMALREIGVIWSAERRLLPAPEFFRRHILETAASSHGRT
jgi:LysR family transcriptional activator of glutamate synthase operon